MAPRPAPRLPCLPGAWAWLGWLGLVQAGGLGAAWSAAAPLLCLPLQQPHNPAAPQPHNLGPPLNKPAYRSTTLPTLPHPCEPQLGAQVRRLCLGAAAAAEPAGGRHHRPWHWGAGQSGAGQAAGHRPAGAEVSVRGWLGGWGIGCVCCLSLMRMAENSNAAVYTELPSAVAAVC